MNSYPEVFHQKPIQTVNPNAIISGPKQLTTIHTSPFNRRLDVIQDNHVGPEQFKHTWSNQRGYGNIVFAKNGKDNKPKINVKPYNRLNRMDCPYSTDVNVQSAWN